MGGLQTVSAKWLLPFLFPRGPTLLLLSGRPLLLVGQAPQLGGLLWARIQLSWQSFLFKNVLLKIYFKFIHLFVRER